MQLTCGIENMKSISVDFSNNTMAIFSLFFQHGMVATATLRAVLTSEL